MLNMMYCSKCNRYEYREYANFCYLCGSKLDNVLLNKLYLILKIPENKIIIELNKKSPMSFPFFLRKEDATRVEVITMHEYPIGLHSVVYKSSEYKKILADETNKIVITPDLIEKLLSQGFQWYHESEMDLLW